MRSSTSSSSPVFFRAPKGSTCCVAGLLAISFLALLEVPLRLQGHRFSIVDDASLWSHERRRVAGLGPRALVFIGTSRVLVDIDTSTFRRACPQFEPVQLGVNGLHPMATLRDLAADQEMTGIVLADMTEVGFIPQFLDDQTPLVRYYRERYTLNDGWNREIKTWLQGHLVLFSGNLGVKRIAKEILLTQSWPKPFYIQIHPDRSESADYAAVADREALRVEKVEGLKASMRFPIPSPEEWLEQARRMEPAVREIQGRGGRVVFIRFPSSDEGWAIEESLFPKALYWDRFREVTQAEVIHFADVPSLSSFRCPDASHLDYRDAMAFTLALTEELARRGILLPAGMRHSLLIRDTLKGLGSSPRIPANENGCLGASCFFSIVVPNSSGRMLASFRN